MEKLKSTPFFKLTLFLIIGIVTSNYFDINSSLYCVFPIVIFVLYFFISKKRSFTKSLFIYLIIFFVGVIITFLKNEKRTFLDYDNLRTYSAIVTEVKEVKSFKRSKVKLLGTDNLGFLFVPENIKLDINDTIVFSTVLQPIKQTSNIGGFNFYYYCVYHDIYFSNFLKHNILLKKNYQIGLVDKLKQWLITSLNKIYKNKQVNSVVNALLLGNKQYLEKDIKQVFTDVGGMHVLAVSGLHVGLLVLFFNFIFHKIQSYKYGKALYFVLLMFILVLFSFLVGNSSSVIRSVFMFLLFSASTVLQKKNNSLNILFFCGFTLLIFNPFYLFDVGFQLSFLAVLGILIFYPLLEKLYLPKSKFIKFLWQLNLISLAAQIFTFPLIIYYFHQFTFLFFISNYITYLLALLLVFGTISVLIISLFSIEISIFISEFIITPLSNKLLISLTFISNFDSFIIKNIYSDSFNICLLFLISLSIVSLFFKFNKLRIYFFLIVFSSIICYNQYLNYSLTNTKTVKFFSYNSSNLLFTVKKGAEALHFYKDSSSFTLLSDFDRENKVFKSKYFNISDYENSCSEFDDFILCLNNNDLNLILNNIESNKEIYFIQKKLNLKKLGELNRITHPIKLYLNNKSNSNLIDNSNVKIIKN